MRFSSLESVDVVVLSAVVRLRFKPVWGGCVTVCEALRMGSVGASLERGAVVAGAEAEGCAAAAVDLGVEEEEEGRMSLMRVGFGLDLGLGGIVGECGLVRGVEEGEVR